MSKTDHSSKEYQSSDPNHSSTPVSCSETGIMRLLREPLVHFLVLGAAFFVGYQYLAGEDNPGSESQQIVVKVGKIEHLVTLFTRTWQRPPTQEELESLIDDYVREEAAYREGIALGLDKNDTIIRRRIRQKLEFISEDLTSEIQPTDEQLEEYLNKHEEDFRMDSELTFRQIYFDPKQHGDDLNEIVSDLAVKLQETPSLNAQLQGDRTLLEFRYERVSEREIANLFGEDFASALNDLEIGLWHGPIESSYGTHVVIIEELLTASKPTLASAREKVFREWQHTRKLELTEHYYQGLLKKHDVIIEWPKSVEESN